MIEDVHFTISNKKYYLLSGNVSDLKICEKDFDQANNIIDMNIYEPLRLKGSIKTNTLTHQYKGKTYTYSVKFNSAIINYFEHYPQSETTVYKRESADKNISNSLISQLKVTIANFSTQKQKVDYLMNFMHKCFPYKTDGEQFGYEKWFFKEEILHYPYSDCEDRSFFFSYLVEQTLGLKTIIVMYPNHALTAVNCTDNSIKGAYITHQGNKFHITDATYINSTPGMMPSGYQSQSYHVYE